jgi:hypothetical protein
MQLDFLAIVLAFVMQVVFASPQVVSDAFQCQVREMAEGSKPDAKLYRCEEGKLGDIAVKNVEFLFVSPDKYTLRFDVPQSDTKLDEVRAFNKEQNFAAHEEPADAATKMPAAIVAKPPGHVVRFGHEEGGSAVTSLSISKG